jgi:hypothetical protein
VATLIPEQDGAEQQPGVDPLFQDLRHMQQRRERDSGVGVASTGESRTGESRTGESRTGESRMELYPVLMMIEAIYARLRAAGWKLLCDELPEVENLLPGAGNGSHYRSDGVSAELVTNLLHTADRLGGQGDLTWLTEIGEALVKRGLARFCPQLPAQLTPDSFVDCVPQLWGNMARHGEVVVLERGPSGARVAIRAQIRPSLEVCAVFAGMLRAQLRLLASHCEVSTIAAQALGDAADIFVLSWAE